MSETQALVLGSTMTEREFAIVFARLAVQLRWTDADQAAVQSYYEALKDFPLLAVEASARRLALEPGRRFFPTTGEWAAVAESEHLTAMKQAISHRPEPWHLECSDCGDTGWVLDLECPGDDTCGRRKIHAAHSFTKPCVCRPTNRTYQRNQRFGAGA